MVRLTCLGLCLGLLAAACSGDNSTTTQRASTSTLATTTTTTTTTTPVPSTSPGTAPTTTTMADDGLLLIEVRQTGGLALLVEGEPVAIGQRVEVPRAAAVRILVALEVADEVHVHGYDLTADATPGVEVVLDFVADIPGIFEVELEDARTLLFELVVS